MPDRRGGFALWAWRLPDQDLSNQWYFIVLAGAGMGLILGPVSTDAVNRAPRTSYGEVTESPRPRATSARAWAWRCWARSSSPRTPSNIENSLQSAGLPAARAEQVADAVSHVGSGSSGEFASRAGPKAKEIFADVQQDYALSSRVVFYVMAGLMLLSFVVALVGMPAGRVEEPARQ